MRFTFVFIYSISYYSWNLQCLITVLLVLCQCSLVSDVLLLLIFRWFVHHSVHFFSRPGAAFMRTEECVKIHSNTKLQPLLLNCVFVRLRRSYWMNGGIRYTNPAHYYQKPRLLIIISASPPPTVKHTHNHYLYITATLWLITQFL